MKHCIVITSIALMLSLPSFAFCQAPAVAVKPSENLLKSGDFEKFQKTYNPWGGVDGQNYLRTFEARAAVVTNEGNTVSSPLPCSANAVDLNGDGLLDLVVADAAGYSWYYPNQGTQTEPKFTFAEVIPIMLSSGGSQCPGMTAVDYEDNGKMGLIFGDWLGQIFYVPNQGGKKDPKFVQPRESRDYLVATSKSGALWGNYFFPAVYDWDGDGRKDLIVGEGTYSANSIWLFLNQGNNTNPIFNEKDGKRISLVRGLGREHLTPVVFDWNGDGFPDIVIGERQGGVSVYINETPNNSKEYKFKPPLDIKFGNTTNIGALSRLSFADINGDGLPDAIIGRSNGRIGIAYNRGTKTEPQFEAIRDIAGINPYPAYAYSPEVNFIAPERSTFHLLKIVSNIATEKETFEEGYLPPPESKGKHSLKLEFYDTKPKVFTTILPLLDETNSYAIAFKNGISITAGKDYTLSFWVKGRNFRRMSWSVECGEAVSEGKDEDNFDLYRTERYSAAREFGMGQDWTKITETFRITKSESNKSFKPMGGTLRFFFNGRGSVYLDDVTVVEGRGF